MEWDFYTVLNNRQVWTPAGHGLGELVTTLSLLPNEELTLEVKTWETSKTQQDSAKILDEKNVSDIKTTSSEASDVATENALKTHEYFDAAASYSGFGAKVSVKGGFSTDVADIQKRAFKRDRSAIERTAGEHRMTRKVKMAISRESGSESKTTRRLRNINQAQTLNAGLQQNLWVVSDSGS